MEDSVQVYANKIVTNHSVLKNTVLPRQFTELLEFLCEKYHVDRSRVFIEYSSRPPPTLKGSRPGYYDGLLSFREKDGHPEFLITVFKISQDPLLTLAHEFAHLVKNLKDGAYYKQLEPPDERAEIGFDDQARRDLTEFQSLKQGE